MARNGPQTGVFQVPPAPPQMFTDRLMIVGPSDVATPRSVRPDPACFRPLPLAGGNGPSIQLSPDA